MKGRSLKVAEVGAFKRRSREDTIRRTAALIEIFKLDPEFTARKKKFETINLVDGRDFLTETGTYDLVILHSILSPMLPLNLSPFVEDECRVSMHHDIDTWRDRLEETRAAYIVVAEGQPYTLSGRELGDLPGYDVMKSDEWLTVYRRR